MSTPDPIATLSTLTSSLDARVKALEADAAGEASKVWTWIKTNWGHFVTWALVAMPLVKKLI
jgi:hypothetical protein